MQSELDFLPPIENQQEFKIASLFTGCGGFDLGFLGGFSHLNGKFLDPLNYKIVFSNDIDKDAIAVYRENEHYFKHEIVHEDIRNISPSDIEDFDLLTAGFPCQPFSSAGLRKGVEDDRGTLFEEVIKFVSAKKPKIIILENVRGILSSKMPDGTPVPEEISKRLSKITCEKELLSYKVSKPMLLNSSKFGVPQNRYRVIMIATRSDVIEPPTEEEILNERIEFCENDLQVRTVLNYEKNLPNTDDVWHLSPQAKKLVPFIKRSWKDIPYEHLPDRFRRIRDNIKKYRSPNFYRRFALDEINGTITASAQPENCGILHPLENRRYNVREIARIQSFPDNFTFNSVTVSNKYKVIGNAVPPVMAYAIAKWSYRALSSYKTKN
jgi:DNA (cytosine-5)-methyltransferase 1